MSSRKRIVVSSFVERNNKLIRYCWFAALCDLKEHNRTDSDQISAKRFSAETYFICNQSACRHLVPFLLLKKVGKSKLNKF